jgi:hypothetical protein
MVLTALLLTLNLLTVYVEPADALDQDDQRVATCVVEALTARPSALVIALSKEAASVVLTVANEAKFRLHVVGRLVAADGRVLADVNHAQKGLNHKLCHQTDGMLEKLAKQLANRKVS